MDDKNEKQGLSRREFIKATGVTTAGAVTASLLGNEESKVTAAPLPKGRVLGANDRIVFAIVGVKGMGGGHLHDLVGPVASDNVTVGAVCDVWQKARQKAQITAKLPDNLVYTDYRKMLENKDIDAVVVATPDHTHAPIAIAAMEAGKHVYIQKPMTRTVEEAFKVHEVAKRTKRTVQVGSQGCSDPKYLKAREIVRSGRLGKMLWAQGSYCRNNPKGEWNYTIDPDANEQTVDWKLWLGGAPKRAWSPERYFRWRKYWDYANGIIGDLWPHRLHPLMLAMNITEFPSTVSCIGGDLCETDKGPGSDGKPYGERRDVADTTMMMVQFPSGAMIYLAGATTNERGIEDMIRGQKANLLFGGGKLQVQPERPFVDEIEAKDETPPDAGETHIKHMRNFIQSMRDNVPPNCDVELGLRVQAVISMAEMSYRKGKTMRFDPNKRALA